MLLSTDIQKAVWKRGDLTYLCHSVQREMKNVFTTSPAHSTLVWLLSRQTGKTTLLAILAFEQCLKKPNSLVVFITDTKDHAQSIFSKKVEETLLPECPEEFKPIWNAKGYTYTFPNGSIIRLFGSDNKHYDKIRGNKADLVLVDEAGFCRDLSDMVRKTLFPTTTHTKGKIILSSTLPPGEHDFDMFVEEAKLEGFLTVKTIHDNPLLTEEDKKAIAKKCGGIDSAEYKQEYLCLKVKDEENCPIPEYNADTAPLIHNLPHKPLFFSTYLAQDLGGSRDFTGILFGYFDFHNRLLVIEDELLIKNRKFIVKDVVKAIKDKYKEHWTNPHADEIIYPTKSVSDHNEIVLNEMRIESNGEVNFKFAKKDDKKAAISKVRTWFLEDRLKIHSRCVNLSRQLEFVKWANSQKDKFARDAAGGHYDLVDTLIYMVRSIDENKNPYPKNYGRNMQDLYINNKKTFNSSHQQVTMANALKRMYGKR